ncbi:hypothetical protein [Streptococcus cuniculipharyngis]|uniref:hypothetical protein n=1 Tax=Streptococcus cuniculipharyngis TaxID=1562651 RepID=UPI0016455F9F|nr:hypothetical protein [Streptococcus cuniculipharyngis]
MTLEFLVLTWLAASLLAGLITVWLWFCLVVWKVNLVLALLGSLIPLFIFVGWVCLIV